MDFAVPADYKEKIKDSEKTYKYMDLASKLNPTPTPQKKTVEYQNH